MVKRYQVYLNQHCVNIFDEVAQVSDYTCSQLIREAINAAASRIGNLIAAIKPRKSDDYTWLDQMTGSIRVKGKKQVNISENIDKIFYL